MMLSGGLKGNEKMKEHISDLQNFGITKTTVYVVPLTNGNGTFPSKDEAIERFLSNFEDRMRETDD